MIRTQEPWFQIMIRIATKKIYSTQGSFPKKGVWEPNSGAPGLANGGGGAEGADGARMWGGVCPVPEKNSILDLK